MSFPLVPTDAVERRDRLHHRSGEVLPAARPRPPLVRTDTPPRRVLLARYPAVHAAMLRRHAVYNASLDLVASMERAGSAFVLRPAHSLVVGRMERDLARLEALYRQGYDETMARMDDLRTWLCG